MELPLWEKQDEEILVNVQFLIKNKVGFLKTFFFRQDKTMLNAWMYSCNNKKGKSILTMCRQEIECRTHIILCT